MSEPIVQCPGCLAKLRVKSSAAQITCPKCGELIRIPSQAEEPKPPRAQAQPPRANADKPASSRAAAPKQNSASGSSGRSESGGSRPTEQRPGRQPERSSRTGPPRSAPSEDFDSYDEEEPIPERPQRRARPESRKDNRGLLIGLIVAVVVAAVSIPTTIVLMNRGDGPADATNAGTPVAVTDPASAPTSPAADAPTTAQTVQTPPAGLQQSAPAASVPAPNIPVASIQVPDAKNKLSYGWKEGDEHVYHFTAEADIGQSTQVVEGNCTFSVVRNREASQLDVEESTGSGFVVSPNGMIVTCAHVVDGASQIEVVLNGMTYPAQIVAANADDDLALLQINATGLSAVAFSDAVQVAEVVRVVGFPLSDVLGEGVKVTTGTVAGLIQDPNRGQRIQVDAAINPGNSGGPIVNDAGQVVAIASAKLSGSLVSSVGFAIPVATLQKLVTAKGLQLPFAPRGSALQGTEVVQRVQPCVAMIKVRGGSGGTTHQLAFTAHYTEKKLSGNQVASAVTGESTNDKGTLRVNSMGEILFFSGNEQLPFVMGPIAPFFIERLDRHGATTWQTETETALRLFEKERDNSPFGMRGPRGPRGPGGPSFGPGFGGPFGDPFGESQERPSKIIPAVERTTYKFVEEKAGRVTIDKSYEFSTNDNAERPYFRIRGKGQIIFDRAMGIPVSLDYNAKLEQNEGASTSLSLPMSMKYTWQDGNELRQQRQQQQTIPNSELVNSLMDSIRKASNSQMTVGPLQKLADIAVVAELQADVLKLVRGYRGDRMPNVKNAAEAAFANWATADEVKGLVEIVHRPLATAQVKAFKRLASFNDPKLYPELVRAMTNPFIAAEVKKSLIEIGSGIEDEILKQIAETKNWVPKREWIEVLQSVGTEKSLPTLEGVVKTGGVGLYGGATNAIASIKARM